MLRTKTPHQKQKTNHNKKNNSKKLTARKTKNKPTAIHLKRQQPASNKPFASNLSTAELPTQVYQRTPRSVANDQDKPLLQIASYFTRDPVGVTLDKTMRASTIRDDDAPKVLVTKLFVQDTDFQTPPVTIRQPLSTSTLSELAGLIQKNLPNQPAFVSFSTTDNQWARHYYNNELPSIPYHEAYRKAGVDMNVLKQTIVDSYIDPDGGIGLPPVPIDISKVKTPILPKFMFNVPPQDVQNSDKKPSKQQENQPEPSFLEKLNTNLTIINRTMAPSTTPRDKRNFSKLEDAIPKFYKVTATHIPLHPFTPLSDLSLCASVFCHISYTQQQIDESPALAEFISKNAKKMSIRKNVYPPETRANLDMTTITYELTQYHDVVGKKNKKGTNSLLLGPTLAQRHPVDIRKLLITSIPIGLIQAYLSLTDQQMVDIIQNIVGEDQRLQKIADAFHLIRPETKEFSRLRMEKETLQSLQFMSELRQEESNGGSGVWSSVFDSVFKQMNGEKVPTPRDIGVTTDAVVVADSNNAASPTTSVIQDKQQEKTD